jgi:hypothetical protein
MNGLFPLPHALAVLGLCFWGVLKVSVYLLLANRSVIGMFESHLILIPSNTISSRLNLFSALRDTPGTFKISIGR